MAHTGARTFENCTQQRKAEQRKIDSKKERKKEESVKSQIESNCWTKAVAVFTVVHDIAKRIHRISMDLWPIENKGSDLKKEEEQFGLFNLGFVIDENRDQIKCRTERENYKKRIRQPN